MQSKCKDAEWKRERERGKKERSILIALLHLRHPPRGVPRYHGPDYDTLPCRFISKPAGRLSKRATETTTSASGTGFRGLIRLNVAPYNFTRGRTFATSVQLHYRPLDKREISLGQFGTIRNSFCRKSKVPFDCNFFDFVPPCNPISEVETIDYRPWYYWSNSKSLKSFVVFG